MSELVIPLKKYRDSRTGEHVDVKGIRVWIYPLSELSIVISGHNLHKVRNPPDNALSHYFRLRKHR